MPLFAADPDSLAAVTAAFGVAGPFVAWVTRKLFQKLTQLLHRFDELGEKVAAVEEKLDSVSDRVKRIEPIAETMQKEFAPNGGSSLRDAVNAIDRRVTILAGQHRARFEGDGLATYECDAAGQCTYASAALAELYGLTPESFLGNGWLRAIKGSRERTRVWHNWLTAIREGIPYEDVYEVQVGDRLTRVRTYTRAVRDKDGLVLCYFGVVTPAPDSKLFGGTAPAPPGPPLPPPPPGDDPTDEHTPLAPEG